MISASIGGRGVAIGLLLILAAARPAAAQSAEIGACLCLEQRVATTRQSMNERTQARNAAQQRLAELSAELAREKPRVDVNDPGSVDRYKALVEQRDAAYRQSVGAVVSEADRAVADYNAVVGQYNSACANHPFDSATVAEVRAHLSCPAPR
jgi:hypothetical protein